MVLVRPAVYPGVRPANASSLRTSARLWHRAASPLTDLGATAAAASSGQIYHPLTGAKQAASALPAVTLPMAGAAGGGVQAVAAFRGWTELVPPDPRDWDTVGVSTVITETSSGVYRVEMPNIAAETYLHQYLLFGAVPYTFNMLWTIADDELDDDLNITESVGGDGTRFYRAPPPSGWERITGTSTADGGDGLLSVADDGSGGGDGTSFYLTQMSFRQEPYALPFTGLAVDAVRAATDAQASASAMSAAAGTIIVTAIPYGEDGASTADRVLFASTDGKYVIWLDQSNSGKLTFSIEDDAGAASTYVGSAPTKDTAVVAAMSWSGSGVTFYVDGAAVGTDTAGSGTWAALAANPYIGHDGGTLDANASIAVLSSADALTAGEHYAVAECLGAGRYFPPQS